jgi:hypothetical protein
MNLRLFTQLGVNLYPQRETPLDYAAYAQRLSPSPRADGADLTGGL